jgi:TRAP-type C4-dicarboxylate transport system substrate-binding protein
MEKGTFKAMTWNLFITLALLVVPFNIATAQKEKPIELKFASHIPGGIPTHKVWEAWAKKLEEQSNGRVKITFYPAQSLVKAKDIYQSTVKDICDIAYEVNSMDPTRFPLTLLTDVPMMGWSTSKMVTRIRKDLYREFPAFREEFKGVKILWQYVSLGPSVLHLTKKAAKIPDDLKGTKIIALGWVAKYFNSIGATPVTLMPPDWYMALNRGVAEGTATTYSVIFDHKVYELLPYHTDVNIGFTGSEVIMNLEKWKSLPPDIQKIIENLEPWVVEQALAAVDSDIKKGRKACEERGQNFVEPTAEETQKWLESGKAVHEKWVEENEGEGRPAKAIYEKAKSLIKEYSK